MAADRSAEPTLLIFDLDGTLYDTTTSFLPTMRAVYLAHRCPYPGDEKILKWVGDPFDVFLDWLVDEQGLPATRSSLSEMIVQEEHRSIMKDGALYPGVESTLLELKNRGFALALCTNGDRAYVDAVLGKFDLLSVFSALQAHGQTGRTKRQMVGDLVARFRPNKAYMIGDRGHDFQAGRDNGCVVVAAAYGFSDEWETGDRDTTLHRFADLLNVIPSREHPSGAGQSCPPEHSSG